MHRLSNIKFHEMAGMPPPPPPSLRQLLLFDSEFVNFRSLNNAKLGKFNLFSRFFKAESLLA